MAFVAITYIQAIMNNNMGQIDGYLHPHTISADPPIVPATELSPTPYTTSTPEPSPTYQPTPPDPCVPGSTYAECEANYLVTLTALIPTPTPREPIPGGPYGMPLHSERCPENATSLAGCITQNYGCTCYSVYAKCSWCAEEQIRHPLLPSGSTGDENYLVNGPDASGEGNGVMDRRAGRVAAAYGDGIVNGQIPGRLVPAYTNPSTGIVTAAHYQYDYCGHLYIWRDSQNNPVSSYMWLHTGIDLTVWNNTYSQRTVVNRTVYATLDGYITRAGMHPGGGYNSTYIGGDGYGYAVYIQDDPTNTYYTAIYGHLNAVGGIANALDYTTHQPILDPTTGKPRPWRKGDRVHIGDVLGLVGDPTTGASTAPHLHYELRYLGKAIDPLRWMLRVRARQGQPIYAHPTVEPACQCGIPTVVRLETFN